MRCLFMTKTYVFISVFLEVRDIGIIFTDTELLLSVLSIFLKMISVFHAASLFLLPPLKLALLNCSVFCLLNLSISLNFSSPFGNLLLLNFYSTTFFLFRNRLKFILQKLLFKNLKKFIGNILPIINIRSVFHKF